MAIDYSAYSDDTDSDTSGGSSGSGGGDYEPDKSVKMVPYAALEGTLAKVFTNENNWGQSLAVKFEDVELVDGCLYHDPDKDNYKLFPWTSVVGVSPGEGDVTADMANQYLVRDYGGNQKRYELVAAVVPDQDEPVTIGNTIHWYSGSQRPKAASKTLAKILTEPGNDLVVPEEDFLAKLTPEQKQKVEDDDSPYGWVYGWLTDTSGNDLLREDLRGRRFTFFEVKKDSNESDRKFHHPIVIDVETGLEVQANNAVDDSDGDQAEAAPAAADGGAVAAPTEDSQPPEGAHTGYTRADLKAMDYNDLQRLAADTEGVSGNGKAEEMIEGILEAQSGRVAAPAEETPEAISDFFRTCATLGYDDPERAESLLRDLMEDGGSDLTAEAIDAYGGFDAVVAEAVE